MELMSAPSLRQPYREERPWGEFIKFTENSPSTVKIITVKPREKTSLQHHRGRDEFWHVISGSGILEIANDRIEAKVGSDHLVVRGTAHRLEGGDVSLVLLEISTGQFSEDDIVRLEDKYGRATEQP